MRGQAIEFLDRVIDPSDTWAGVDTFPSGLREQSIKVVQAELDKYDLQIMDCPGRGKGLFTRRSLREAEVVAQCTSLWFLSHDKLLDCLRSGDNWYFGDSVP